MILFINCCITKNNPSRTLSIAKYYTESIKKLKPLEEFQYVDLRQCNINFLTPCSLLEREKLIAQNRYNHPIFNFSKQFAHADEIIIAAPYWDLSFPGALKAYFEQISVNNITFCTINNKLKGLCRAKSLTYITTAGGFVENLNLGGEYIKGICDFLGIPEYRQISAWGLDMPETDISKALQNAFMQCDRLLGK